MSDLGIVATFTVKAKGDVATAIDVINSYASMAANPNFPDNIELIARAMQPYTSSQTSTAYAENLKARIVSNSAVISSPPTHLGDEGLFSVTLEIPYTSFNWTDGGIPQLLVRFAGNLFRITEVEKLIWSDLSVPKSFSNNRRFGARAIREHLQLKENESILAATLYPNIGLADSEIGALSRTLVDAGAHSIIEDEIIGNTNSRNWDRRISIVSNLLENANTPSVYFLSITSWSEYIRSCLPSKLQELNQNNQMVKFGVHVSPLYGGYQQIRQFAELGNCPVYAHYYELGLMIRNESVGISSKVLSTLATFAGADIVYIGHAAGRHTMEPDYVLKYVADWLGGENAIPCISGGVNQVNVLRNFRKIGSPLFLDCASAIFNHPNGPVAGVTSMRKMMDLYMLHCRKCKLQDISKCTPFQDLLRSEADVKALFQHKLPEI